MSAPVAALTGRRPDPALHALWQQRLQLFETSGLSVSAFCAQQRLSLPSFYSWRRRLRSSAPLPAADAPRFVPIRLLPAAPPVELLLPSGPVLRLAPRCDLAFVRSLVDSLGGAPC
jgi:hypothetical protein